MFFRRLVTVSIIVVLAGFVTGIFLDYRYKKRWGWLFFDKIDEALKGKTNYDIILLGNSRVHTGLNPYYVDSLTKMNSYNLAIGSGDEEEMKLLSTLYLGSHLPPKFVVIGLDNSMLVKYNILKERFAYLFYLQNDTVSAAMQKKGFPTSFIRLLPFIKYSFFDEYNRTSLFVGNGQIKKLFKHNYYKGFVNIFDDDNISSITADTLQKTNTPFNTLPSSEKINDTAANTFRHTVKMFLSEGTRVIFLNLPERKKTITTFSSPDDSFYLNLSKELNIPIIRADTSSLFTDKYFVGGNHLNEPGSELLSLLVANFIKDLK
ncbi:MAG: hypothetical protein ABUT20_31575 [Bacteroidota bacterium]